MRSGRQVILVALAAIGAGTLGLVAACGARSGLDAPTGEEGTEAGTNADGPVIRGVHQLDCAEAGITYIYTIASDNTIYSFYPTTGEFTRIGLLACPAPFGATPFSMAVDHKGTAYVVFSNRQNVGGVETLFPGDGELFKVSTKNATCEATPFVPGQQGFQTFGMGFVANAADGGQGETLYVAADTTPALGTIDVNSFRVREIAPFQNGGTELTGTGGGRLFGFYPIDFANTFLGPSYIVEIDPRTAAVRSSVTLPDVVLGSGWAFGFWGGDFYTFTAPSPVLPPTTVVQRYRPSDGSITQVATAPPGVEIVGAGVSTCAPQQ